MKLEDLELAVADEYGVHFETGKPVTFKYVRNTEKSPNFGSRFGQDIEPAGRYMLHNPDPGRLGRGWEAGEITFNHPLVIPLSGDRYNIYGPTGWKARLHEATGLTHGALTRKLQAAGYDAIVTVDPDGYTREIVDMTTTHAKKNPPRREDAWAEVKREAAEYRAKQSRDRGRVLELLKKSPAIRGVFGPGKSYEQPRMAIVSGELSDTERGAYRVTFFGTDGPYGHNTKPTIEKIAQEIIESFEGPYEAMTDDDVIAWTSTDEFVIGSKVIAFVQADNTLRYLASKAGRYEWGAEISRKANAMGKERVDEAIEVLHAAIRELPTPNPRIAGFVMNPPWVTKVLADAYEELDDKVPARWLPQLTAVFQRSSKGIIADLVEFGCGSYGCVLATLDPDTVLKVTSDPSEADFAAKLSPTLVADVCVEYRMVVRLDRKHEGRPIHLLWRESASEVGNIDQVLDNGEHVEAAIHQQHEAGKRAFHAFMTNQYTGKAAEHAQPYIREWLASVHAMGNAVPELRELAVGLTKIWRDQRILFGDLHGGNLGLVRRSGRDVWVITDPGNIAVVGA